MTFTPSNLDELIMLLEMIRTQEGNLSVQVYGQFTSPEVLVKIRGDGSKYVEVSGREP